MISYRPLGRADSLREAGYFAKAEALYISVLRSSSDPAVRAEASLGSALGLRAVGDTNGATSRLKDARRWAKTAGLDLADRIDLEEALVLRAAEKYDEALKRLKPRLRGADTEEAAFLWWAVGGCYRFQGRLAESVATFRKSMALAALFGLAGAVRVRGDAKASDRFYREAGRLFEGTGDDFGRAYAACGGANALRQLGRLDDAERGYRRAYAIYAKLGDPVDLAYVDWGWGEVHLKRGELAQALKRFAAAERAFRDGHETRGVVLCLHSRARALHAQGATHQAERLFSEGVKLALRAKIHTHLESFT
ncbi:MAG: Tetratricopeptide domain-containing protein [Elusimicrobia bacterium]|nr:MAG: Tetratricopeptide domain-containing protein [Elusimicrobiota bacterium]